MEENKMGTMPINKLLVNMSLPMVISMLVQALYNFVDSIFVARISDPAITYIDAGKAAINAVGMAFPFQTLIIAFGNGVCVGMNAILSKALGEKDNDKVQKAAMNGIFLQILNAVLFFFVGLFGAEFFIRTQGGEKIVLEYGTQYLSIVCMASVFIFTQVIFERLLQSTGRTIFSMITQSTGAIINIILDPILIFGYFGFPEMKVAGAAIATIIGQAVAAIMAIIFNIKFNKDVKIKISKFRPDLEMIKKILSVGVPTMIMQSIGSVMTFFMNKLLSSLNDIAVTVFTVYFKLQSLFFMPVFGLNNGLIPILAYNYGAQKRKRMIQVIKLSMVYAFVFMLIGFGLFELVPGKLLNIFDTEGVGLVEIGVPALKIIGVHFLAAWFCIVSGTVFQALGNGVYSLIVSAARQLVVLLPVAYLFAKIGGLDMVWWCFPVAEVMSLLVSTIFLVRIFKKVISKVPA